MISKFQEEQVDRDRGAPRRRRRWRPGWRLWWPSDWRRYLCKWEKRSPKTCNESRAACYVPRVVANSTAPPDRSGQWVVKGVRWASKAWVAMPSSPGGSTSSDPAWGGGGRPLQCPHHQDGGAPALHIIDQRLEDCEVSSAITPLHTGGGRGLLCSHQPSDGKWWDENEEELRSSARWGSGAMEEKDINWAELKIGF